MKFSSSEKRYIIVGLFLVGFLIGIVFVLKSFQPHRVIPLEGGKVKGPINAPVWIQEFSDFQCPSCQKATQMAHAIFDKYPGKIRLIFYHFPLRMHPWANLAHQCAECAFIQGKFWPYHDILYAKQSDWVNQSNPKETLVQYAISLGMNEASFRQCVNTGQGGIQVMGDMQRGQFQQVDSTPTFFVNGKRILGGVTFQQELEKTIQQELGKKS